MTKRSHDDMNSLRNCQEITSLHSAVRSGSLNAVRNFIQTGVSVDSLDDTGLTPLLLAVLTDQPECVKLLLTTCPDVNFSTSKHGTGLHIACSHGNLQIVNYLLLAGADSSLCGPDKQTCLHLAAAGGHLDVLKSLVYNKSSVNVSDRNGVTPLHLSVINDHEEVTLFLIDNGALVNKQDVKGNLPLHYAVKQSNIEIIKTLIAQGCDKDRKNYNEEAPICTAVRIGHVQTLLLLVKLGCRTDIRQTDGCTTIHTLVSTYNSKYPTYFRTVLEMLLYGGCDINSRAYSTLETPLYRAISLTKSECAEVLLAYGADPNISSPFDITALRLAYMRQLSQTCVFMLHCGMTWNRESWIKSLPSIHSSEPNTVLEKCKHWRTQPSSLLNICRIAFRKHYGKDLHRMLVKRVDMPCAIKNFFLLNDLKRQKYNSFLESFGGGSWVNSLLDEEIEYGPFKRRKNDIPDIC